MPPPERRVRTRAARRAPGLAAGGAGGGALTPAAPPGRRPEAACSIFCRRSLRLLMDFSYSPSCSRIACASARSPGAAPRRPAPRRRRARARPRRSREDDQTTHGLLRGREVGVGPGAQAGAPGGSADYGRRRELGERRSAGAGGAEGRRPAGGASVKRGGVRGERGRCRRPAARRGAARRPGGVERREDVLLVVGARGRPWWRWSGRAVCSAPSATAATRRSANAEPASQPGARATRSLSYRP